MGLILKRFNGLDNQNDSMDIGLEGLSVAKNVDVNRKGQLSSRVGYTSTWSGTPTAISDNLILTSAGALLRIEPGGLTTQLGTGISGDSLTSAIIDGLTYFSTEEYNGVVENGSVRDMGLNIPAISVSVEVGPGNLLAGRYLICASSVASDGRESGQTDYYQITLLDNSRITITTTVDTGLNSNIYMSSLDGMTCYYIATTTSLVVDDPTQVNLSKDPVNRQYMGKMPYGSIFEEHRGRLLCASGNELFASESLDYELCGYNDGYTFDSKITMINSVENGFFVSNQTEVFFAAGDFSSDMVLRSVFGYGAMNGTAKRIKMTHLGEGSPGYGVIFTATDGSICLGGSDGTITNLTDRKFLLNTQYPLTGVVNGDRYLVTTIQ